MPSAVARTAASVKPGALRSMRSANCRSCLIMRLLVRGRSRVANGDRASRAMRAALEGGREGAVEIQQLDCGA